MLPKYARRKKTLERLFAGLVKHQTFIDYEQSLLFLLRSRKRHRESRRAETGKKPLVFPRPSFRAPAFAMSSPRLDELKREIGTASRLNIYYQRTARNLQFEKDRSCLRSSFTVSMQSSQWHCSFCCTFIL